MARVGTKDRVQECPNCSCQTTVIETRGSRRRRLCSNCNTRYSTIEIMSDGVDKLIERELLVKQALKELRRLTKLLEEEYGEENG